MRCHARSLALLGCAVAVACNDSTSPQDRAFDAADAFTRIADSVALVDGASAAAPYYGIADALGRAGSFTAVSVTFDGQQERWNALGTETVIKYVFEGVTTAPVPAGPVLIRSLLLWDPAAPRRVAQLIAFADGDIGFPVLPSGSAQPTISLPKGVLSYSDGKGSAWMGKSGTQSSSSQVGTDACPERRASANATSPCRKAEFQFQVDATLDVPPFALARNNASGTHTLALPNTRIAGAQITTTVRLGAPPVSNARLVGRLTAAVSDSVTLTYEVSNPTDAPVQLTFSDAQRFDFVIVSGTQKIWQWSADKAFAQVIGNHTWPPGEVATYTAKWLPTAKGVLAATAWLAKTGERAPATAIVEVK